MIKRVNLIDIQTTIMSIVSEGDRYDLASQTLQQEQDGDTKKDLMLRNILNLYSGLHCEN